MRSIYSIMALYLITPNICDYTVELQIDAAILVPPSTLQLSVLEQIITRACTQLHTLFDQTMGQTVDAMVSTTMIIVELGCGTTTNKAEQPRTEQVQAPLAWQSE